VGSTNVSAGHDTLQDLVSTVPDDPLVASKIGACHCPQPGLFRFGLYGKPNEKECTPFLFFSPNAKLQHPSSFCRLH
jgi:hypothetical protein